MPTSKSVCTTVKVGEDHVIGSYLLWFRTSQHLQDLDVGGSQFLSPIFKSISKTLGLPSHTAYSTHMTIMSSKYAVAYAL